MSIAARPADHTWPPRWPGILAWSIAGATVLSLAPSVWLLSQVSFEGSSEAAPAPMTVGPVALAVVSSAAVGALLAGRRPRHPVGWLLLGVGYAVAANVFIEPYVLYGVLTRPGSLPGARLLLPFLYSTFFIALSCASFVLLLTRPGRCRRRAGAGGPG